MIKLNTTILFRRLLVLAVLFGFSQHLLGQDFTDRKRDIGIGLGYLFEGEAYFAFPDVYSGTAGSVFLRFFYDHYFSEKITAGGYVQFAPTAEFFRFDNASMIELGLAFKPRFILADQFALKPGFNVGYRKFSSDNDFVDSNGLATNLSIELQYDWQRTFIPFFELGFLAQPAGGNDFTDITFGPKWYIMVGADF